MMRYSVLVLAAAVFCGYTLSAALGQEKAGPTTKQKVQQVIEGRLSGFDMPGEWKVSERAKMLTYTNPFKQNLAARWVKGEIVYRVSFGKVKVDPKTTKVAKEYIAVYAAPGPDEPPTHVERVPGQLSIYDTKPGDKGYSPIWHYHYVIVPRDYKPNTLRSEQDVLESGYNVVPVDYFSN